VLLLECYKRFNLLVCCLLLRCLFSIDILVVVNAVPLFTGRTFGCLSCLLVMRAFSWILTMIASVVLFGWRVFCSGSVLLNALGGCTTVSEI
jgi:hypothetical protein